MTKIKTRQAYFKTDFRIRESENDKGKYIEGYFIKFNEETELYAGVYEEVDPDCITNSLRDNDIRALFDHQTALVLGRTGNNTLELKRDDIGLYGIIRINENDKQAMDILARVERGDINACSFGFNIIKEEMQEREDGTVKFILKEIDLLEVSIVTFPAYDGTSVSARKKDVKEYKQRRLEVNKKKLKERLKNA